MTWLLADGTLKNVYYNGFTQEHLTGRNRGVGGLEALGVELELRELARDRVYEFLYLNLTERIRGATGSPVRPVAIR